MQAAGAGGRMTEHLDAEFARARFNRLEDGRRDGVGMDVDGHGMIPGLVWRNFTALQ
jgi:hypothetical protein